VTELEHRGNAFLAVRATPARGASFERPVLVLVCYLDDSGTSGSPIVTMAGFITSLGIWETLEASLNDLMNEHGVPVFHAKEFHDTKPPFKGWTRDKKERFADDLFSIVDAKIFGISLSAQKDVFAAYKKETQTFASTSAIGTCFGMIVHDILRIPLFVAGARKEGLSFMVESGNSNNGEIEKHFHALSKERTYEGVLRSITFISKAHCRAIQLADFLAFYSRRQARGHSHTAVPLNLPRCRFIEIMKRHVPVLQKVPIGQPETVAHLDNIRDLTALMSVLRTKPS
jgi:hypothetical protein